MFAVEEVDAAEDGASKAVLQSTAWCSSLLQRSQRTAHAAT